MSVKACNRAANAARSKARTVEKTEAAENSSSSSCSSGSSGSSNEGGDASVSCADKLSVTTIRNKHRQSRRLKEQRKKIRKQKTSSKTKYRVPLKTICTIKNDNDTSIARRSQGKKRSAPSSRSDKLQVAGSALGGSIALSYYVWQYGELLQIMAPTLAVILGVGCFSVVLIHIQDRLDNKLQSSSSHEATLAAAPSLLHLPGRLGGRDVGTIMVNKACTTPHPQSTKLPQSDLLLPQHNHTKLSLSHTFVAATNNKLNPIEERVLEEKWDQFWHELDSQTQYYALIIGYTQHTWDADYELEDLSCEDWGWDEMTSEQKAAAQHFGYTQEEWDVG